jgi:uncharacterized protein involved in type VI secretion and phage assembly
MVALPVPDDGMAPGYFGVYPAIVTDIVDTSGLGRVQVRFPMLGHAGDRDVRAWATLCSPYADDDQGLQVLPEVGSQVVVAFEAGNARRPYIIGAAWHGKAQEPRKADRSNNIRVLRSRGGSELEFDDQSGAEKVSITMKSGHEVVLDNAAGDITIRHQNGSSITLDRIGNISVQATNTVNVNAGQVIVDTAMATFTHGIVCETITASAFVISPAYTPGVGNLL